MKFLEKNIVNKRDKLFGLEEGVISAFMIFHSNRFFKTLYSRSKCKAILEASEMHCKCVYYTHENESHVNLF